MTGPDLDTAAADTAATGTVSTGTASTDAPPRCPACPHERDAHDTNGTRFCAATTAADLDRGCICVGATRLAVAR